MISAQTVQQMVDRVMALPPGSRLVILAPIVRSRKGEYRKLFFDLRRQGYMRVRVNGQWRCLAPVADNELLGDPSGCAMSADSLPS